MPKDGKAFIRQAKILAFIFIALWPLCLCVKYILDKETMPDTWFGMGPPLSEYGHASAVIIEAPYEGTVTYGKGASRGPEAARRASQNIELYSAVLDAEPAKVGIHGRPPLHMPEDPERAVMAVKSAVVQELETGRRPVLVGGEHSLTAGSVKACLENYPSLTVLQLDAHADLRDTYDGSPFSHACVMRRVHELGARFVQAGIRSMSIEEKEWLQKEGRDLVYASDIRAGRGWVKRTLDSLSEVIYVTVDVDVMDPSEMPATGTPEPGGVSCSHLVELFLCMRESGKQVVGFDLMELAPVPGLHFPDFTCASLIYNMIGAFWA